MADKVQVASYESGELKVLAPGDGSREAVLALPLCRLLVKVVRVPEESRGDPAAFAQPILQSMSPYPDEPLAVSCETVRDEPEALTVLAVALPESSSSDIEDALDAAKLRVTRVDALELGAIRALWPQLRGAEPDGRRRLVVFAGTDCASIFVLDGDSPSAVRAASPGSDLAREALLTLFEAEELCGPAPLAECVVVGDMDAKPLEGYAPVRRVAPAADAASPLAERAADPATLNALPQTWREVLLEARFKKKLTRFVAVAVGIWALVMGVLFGVPLTYGMLTKHQRAMSKDHARAYQSVKTMKEKVDLVKKYSDHDLGALEMLKMVSDRLPSDVELKSWNFKRGSMLAFSGEADSPSSVYALKRKLDALVARPDLGEAGVFESVMMQGPRAVKGKQMFDIDCKFVTDGEGTR